MEVAALLGSALALSMDNFAVAAVLTLSMSRPTPWQTFRLCGNFGIFQSLMTLLGFLGGAGASAFVGSTGCWMSFGVLTLLGVNMVRGSSDNDRGEEDDPTKGWKIIALSLACALDSLVAGFSLSLMGAGSWHFAPVFGLCAAIMAFIGTRVGKLAGIQFGQWPQRIGGFALIAIGIRGVIQQVIWH